jgi:hypothetical protein
MALLKVVTSFWLQYWRAKSDFLQDGVQTHIIYNKITEIGATIMDFRINLIMVLYWSDRSECEKKIRTHTPWPPGAYVLNILFQAKWIVFWEENSDPHPLAPWGLYVLNILF